MALAIIAGILIVLFGVMNPVLSRLGKNKIDDAYAFPLGLFLIMCYLSYEFSIPLFHVFLVFIFGLAIGESVARIHYRKQKKKSDSGL